jgi:hypothetical protein
MLTHATAVKYTTLRISHSLGRLGARITWHIQSLMMSNGYGSVQRGGAPTAGHF